MSGVRIEQALAYERRRSTCTKTALPISIHLLGIQIFLINES